MDQVDSLNEMALQSTPMTNVGVSIGNVPNTSQVIAVTADLPSFHHYFISEHAKSFLALQELQNEVGALLQFRDLVMEAFPQLGQKVQDMQSPHAISAMSPSKWEPGIRVKRKLGQQLRDSSDVLVPSLLPRYRSNSQGKGSRSGEISGSATSSSSAIQDSGFCTESSKDHLSGLSSRSKSRDTADELSSLLDNIHSKGTRMKLEIEYLWALFSRKEEGASSPGVGGGGATKRRCKSLDDLMFANDGSATAAHSFTFEYAVKTAFLETELGALKRERDVLLKKLNDVESEHLANLAQTNRLLSELETMSAEKRELEDRLQLAVHGEQHHHLHHRRRDDVDNDDDHVGSDGGCRVNDLQANFLTRHKWRQAPTPFAKCQLLKLEQVFKGTTTTTTTTNCRQGDDAVASAHRGEVTVADAVHAIRSTPPVSSSSAAFEDGGYSKSSSAERRSPLTEVDAARLMERPANPVTKELMNNSTASYRVDGGDSVGSVANAKTEAPSPLPPPPPEVTSAAASNATSVVTLASTKEFNDVVDQKLGGGGGGVVVGSGAANVGGKPDVLIGFVSGHPSSFDSSTTMKRDGGGVTLSREKVLSILNEYDTKTLHCFLLTLSYQVEALNVHVQRVAKSRMSIFRQLSRYKFENEDLRLELKKKEIELEGTKAQKRVLEQKRDVKLSYSTSDLMATAAATVAASSPSSTAASSMAPKSCTMPAAPDSRLDERTSPYSCSVSDSALMADYRRRGATIAVASTAGRGGGGVAAPASGGLSESSAADHLRTTKSGGGGGSGCRRSCSKIPLKTYSSRLPAKLYSNSGGKKTLTSFKEYSAPGPPHSSCISSTSSSLNHK